MTLEQIRDELRSLCDDSRPRFEQLLSELTQLKNAAVIDSDEALANRIWCYEMVALVQREYLNAFEQLKKEQYYKGWCTLEQVELGLLRLSRHFPHDWPEFKLDFIDDKVRNYQSIFPYKIFTSPEIVYFEQKCSICDQVISIRHPCGHKVGELYYGQHCGRIVTKSEFVGLAFVDRPVQKYSVPFFHHPETGEAGDHYNYQVVRYLMIRLPGPFDDWNVTWTKTRHPFPKFGLIGRNDTCPCDSGKKFKNCCRRQGGVLRPHVKFTFLFPVPDELVGIEFTY